MSDPIEEPAQWLHPSRSLARHRTQPRDGDPNVRGHLRNADGRFALRPDLHERGAYPMNAANVEVFADWDKQVEAGAIPALTVKGYRDCITAMTALAGRYGLHQVAEISPNFVLTWLDTPGRSGTVPSISTKHHHRAALRKWFETLRRLGITDANPALQVALPRPAARRATACTDEQIDLLKRIAQIRIRDTRTPAMLALALSGAAVTEQGFLTVADVDLINERVWVHDGGYRSFDRWIPLQDRWSLFAVAAHVSALRRAHGDEADGQWLIYRPGTKPLTPQQTIASQKQAAPAGLTKLMKKAGIHRTGTLRVDSIREWLALQVWEQTGSIEAVAIRLGYHSLDAAATLIGYDWRSADLTAEAAPAHRDGAQS